MSQPNPQSSSPLLDVRADFPVLDQDVNGKPLVYLDSAASAQQPRQVIDAVADYHLKDHANVHRGVHTLSQRATDAFEGARDRIVEFVNANSRKEIILTAGTTESINLVAQSFARPRLGKGDKILVTHLEHHSNMVPWQLVCEQTGAELVVAPIDDHGQLMLDELRELMTPDVLLLAVGHVSNALGTVNPVKDIVGWAKQQDITVLVDGAQGVPHMDIDVQDLGCDFYAFSGHKMYGPTGTGVLYGREELLEEMPPWQGGGDMILEVFVDRSVFNELPYKFEAGTPNIAGIVGLGAAVDYLRGIGPERVAAHEHYLLDYMTEQLTAIEGLKPIGTAEHKTSVLSFMLDDIHPHDIGTILDHEGVAIRTGHHCAMPVMQRFGLPGTARASLGVYNSTDDVDRLANALLTAKRLFA
ncbi:MAG: cysteine desulfurase [Woeseiaceae bacterium]|nr:cysteine desulfurase [Woeseiaceae bacterium]